MHDVAAHRGGGDRLRQPVDGAEPELQRARAEVGGTAGGQGTEHVDAVDSRAHGGAVSAGSPPRTASADRGPTWAPGTVSVMDHDTRPARRHRFAGRLVLTGERADAGAPAPGHPPDRADRGHRRPGALVLAGRRGADRVPDGAADRGGGARARGAHVRRRAGVRGPALPLDPPARGVARDLRAPLRPARELDQHPLPRRCHRDRRRGQDAACGVRDRRRRTADLARCRCRSSASGTSSPTACSGSPCRAWPWPTSWSAR